MESSKVCFSASQIISPLRARTMSNSWLEPQRWPKPGTVQLQTRVYRINSPVNVVWQQEPLARRTVGQHFSPAALSGGSPTVLCYNPRASSAASGVTDRITPHLDGFSSLTAHQFLPKAPQNCLSLSALWPRR